MRKFVLAAALAATVIPTTATFADPPPWAPAHGRRAHDAARDWRDYRRYDWDRPDIRYGRSYDASRYYRDGRYYSERPLSRADRIYRGTDGRYYCRRSDGTTGLIIGAVAGGLLGNKLDKGRSSTLGTVLGAVAGGALGRAIERGELRCR
jgi:hypothetical protein